MTQTTSPPRTTLLIVDDEPAVLETLGQYLQTRGYDTQGVTTAAEAVETYRRWQPALVLLDIRLPGESGVEVMKKLRAINPQAKVVMMTGVPDFSVRQAAMAAGAAAFVFKPLEVTAIDRILRSVGDLHPLGPVGPRPTIMILDDEPEIRMSLKFYLIGQGMDVFVAGSGEEGLAMLRSVKPTPRVLILDLGLPHLSGMEFLKLIRQTHPEVAVIVLTALGTMTMRQASERLGVRQFLRKPLPLHTIEQAIRDALTQQSP